MNPYIPVLTDPEGFMGVACTILPFFIFVGIQGSSEASYDIYQRMIQTVQLSQNRQLTLAIQRFGPL